MGVDKENFYDIMAVRRTKYACVTSIPQAARRPCTAFASEKESYYENRFKVVASYRCRCALFRARRKTCAWADQEADGVRGVRP